MSIRRARGRAQTGVRRGASSPGGGAPGVCEAVHGLSVGEDVWLLTWLHQSERTTLEVHPRDDESRPLAGVFATRSPDRPNPIGLHRVRLLAIEDGRWLRVAALEAIDGTPVVDIKPVLTAAPLESAASR